MRGFTRGLWGLFASMNGMRAPDASSNTTPSSTTPTSSATPTVPRAVKPLSAFWRTLALLSLVVFPAWSFIGFLTRDHWGQWAFHLSQARVIVSAVAVLAFLPIVWSAFSRFAIDLIRRIKPSPSGKHAPEAHPGTAFLGVVASLVVFGVVGMTAWDLGGQTALDWRDGPVRREGVTCTAMTPVSSDDGPFVHIELTQGDGSVRAYDLRQYELDRHAAKGTPLYNTIVEACQTPGTQIGISLYERTGTIVEAWRSH